MKLIVIIVGTTFLTSHAKENQVQKLSKNEVLIQQQRKAVELARAAGASSDEIDQVMAGVVSSNLSKSQFNTNARQIQATYRNNEFKGRGLKLVRKLLANNLTKIKTMQPGTPEYLALADELRLLNEKIKDYQKE